MTAIVLVIIFRWSRLYFLGNLLPQLWPLIEPASEGGDDIIVSCLGLPPPPWLPVQEVRMSS
jgi:hypothetical protein